MLRRIDRHVYRHMCMSSADAHPNVNAHPCVRMHLAVPLRRAFQHMSYYSILVVITYQKLFARTWLCHSVVSPQAPKPPVLWHSIRVIFVIITH